MTAIPPAIAEAIEEFDRATISYAHDLSGWAERRAYNEARAALEAAISAALPPPNKRFRLHWRGGKTEEVIGPEIASAMNNAGYGGGAVRALDWYEEIHDVP